MEREERRRKEKTTDRKENYCWGNKLGNLNIRIRVQRTGLENRDYGRRDSSR
jgi:hypothetical protein